MVVVLSGGLMWPWGLLEGPLVRSFFERLNGRVVKKKLEVRANLSSYSNELGGRRQCKGSRALPEVVGK